MPSTGEVSAALELQRELPEAFLRGREKRKYRETRSHFQKKKKKSYLKIMGIAEECLSTEDICHFLIANLQNKNKNSDGF